MTDWQIQPLAKTCAVTGAPLQPGDRVTSFIYRDAEGAMGRADVAESAAVGFAWPGAPMGRWTREVKTGAAEERENQRQAVASAEEFFLSLFEDHGEAAASAEGADTLKQVLALMLERKRVLKRVRPGEDGSQVYRHAATDREVTVPMHDPDPQDLVELQGQLGQLFGL